jgi:multiple sugar transport system permease protein
VPKNRWSQSIFPKLVGAETPLQAQGALWGYIFLLPWLLGLIIFVVGPILASFYLSFTQYNILTPPKFVGLANYSRAFTQDSIFWPSLGRTFFYAILVVPIGLSGSLGLALLLNQRVRGTPIFRAIFFIPSLTPTVALALLWTWLFDPTVGPINTALVYLGLPGPGWLTSSDWALPALIIIALWASFGGSTMIIFLAGLQGVPQELVDAAVIDGAGTWSKFWNVTLPMISPTMLFNLVLGVIGTLQVFTLAFVATNGGPSYATWFFALDIYSEAFKYLNMGYGAALAWVLVVIVLILTLINLVLSRRWVYYAGE